MSSRAEATPRRVSRPAARTLARVPEGRVFYGVASGLANYLAIDPTLVRTSFGLLSLAGGLGIVAYLGLALVLPERHSERPLPRARRSGMRPLVSVLLIT